MALIQCPECGKEISDRADKCIHCGYPLNQDQRFDERYDDREYDDQKPEPEEYYEDEYYEEEPYQPPVLTTRWVTLLALIPLIYGVIRYVFRMPAAALLISLIANFVFLIIDFIEVGKDEEHSGAWVYWGLIATPLYIFFRDKKIDRNLKHFFLFIGAFVIAVILGTAFSDGSSKSSSSNSLPTSVKTTTVTTKASSFQDIYNTYILKMQNETPRLQEEFKNEAKANTKGTSGLADILSDKTDVLASLYSEGAGEMAKLIYTSGNSYDDYDSWATKLYNDGYSKEFDKLYDLYSGYMDEGEAAFDESEPKTYEEIYNEYVEKLQETTPGLIDEFLSEAPGNTEGYSGLVDIYQDKSEVLLDIYQDGSEEMRKAYQKHSNGVYSEYDDWRGKLYDVFDDERHKIYKTMSDYRSG